jgi:hypothetical protein
MSFSCECCVLSGRGLLCWPLTHPEGPTEFSVSVVLNPQ